jgi:hypothetical protein
MIEQSNSLSAVDAARGVIITVVVTLVGYISLAPADEPNRTGLSISNTGLGMLLVGVGLQLAILFSRPLINRFERASGLEGQLSPVVVHILKLIADGLTVLLFALAVFGGIARFEDNL